MCKALLAIALLASAKISLQAQSPCKQADIPHTTNKIATLRSQLRSITIGDDGTTVPPLAQQLLPQLKSSLIEITREVMACQSTSASPQSIEQELASILHANPPQPPPDTVIPNNDKQYTEAQSDLYSSNLRVNAHQESQSLTGITFTFTIPCGNDTIWMLFDKSGTQWQPALVWQAPPYKEISGAFGDVFLTGIISGKTNNSWRAVIVHGHPWCTSRFSGLDIDVIAPSSSFTHPQVIWHTIRGYSRGDFNARLHTTTDTFELFINAASMDVAGYERTVVYRYQLRNDHVQRIGPIAVNGRGFVEEWLNAPWDETLHFSNPQNLPELKAAYDLNAKHNGTDDFWVYTDGSVRACIGNPKRFQVEFDVENIHNITHTSYFQIEQNNSGYTMLTAASSQPDKNCDGPDIMKKP
jgi:hypothetical protein